MMALVCSIALNVTSYRAGSTPPPACSVKCYNSGAADVTVKGVEVYGYVFGSSTLGRPVPMGNALPPYGPGAPVTVTAGSSASIGPFPITVASAAAALRDGSAGNLQPSQPLDFTLMVGATVYGSDLSISRATEQGFLVSQSIAPKVGAYGGSLIFSEATNSGLYPFFF